MKSKKEVGKKEKIATKGLKRNSLQVKYAREIVPQMMKELDYESPMAVPRLKKIVLNTGIGHWTDKKDAIEKIKNDLAVISGQMPVYTIAKQAISGFNVRVNQKVGIMVTLRGRKMYDFLERLIVEALPRVRDFRGISSKNFGERGNVNIGR